MHWINVFALYNNLLPLIWIAIFPNCSFLRIYYSGMQSNYVVSLRFHLDVVFVVPQLKAASISALLVGQLKILYSFRIVRWLVRTRTEKRRVRYFVFYFAQKLRLFYALYVLRFCFRGSIFNWSGKRSG